jgi:NitT/TauT family transport system substrate-binding protein
MHRRRLLQAAAGTSLLAPVTWLNSRRPVGAQNLDILNVGASPFINQGTVFMASEMGLFAKLGLDIRIKSYPDGALIVAPLLAEELDLGVVTCSAALFNSLSRGGPYRAFLCLGQGRRGRAVSAVVVRNDHYENGVRTVKDLARLKGSIVAVGATGSINQYSISSALGIAGLKPSADVRWQTNVEQPEIVKQFGRNQVDAAELTYHLAYVAEKQGWARIIAARDEIVPDSQTVMMAARNRLFETRRAVLVRFAMAYIHAAQLFNKVAGDPGAYSEQLQMITKYIFLKDVDLLKAISPHWDWVAEDGRPNVASVMAQQDHWADQFKLVELKVSPEQIFKLEIADEATRRLAQEKPFG